MTAVGSLSALDEHAIVITASADVVWSALVARLDESFGSRAATAYAALVGCAPRRSAGPRPLAVGSTIPGFRVVIADPGRELRLEGRHRFSTYALTFQLDDTAAAGATHLTARSEAEFPGVGGRVYRLLVIGSGFHVAGIRSQLAAIQRHSEAEVQRG